MLLTRTSSVARKAATLILSVFDARDLLFFGGIASVCYGVALIYPPAAWIIGGAASAALGVKGAR